MSKSDDGTRIGGDVTAQFGAPEDAPDLQRLRTASELLLSRASQSVVSDLASAVEKATAVIRLSADIARSKSELLNADLENKKLDHEIKTSADRERLDRRKDYVTLLAPIIAVLGLLAPLTIQTLQLRSQAAVAITADKEKQQAAKDASWNAVVASASRSMRLPPEVAALRPFLSDNDYRDRARSLIFRLVVRGNDPGVVEEIFDTFYAPVTKDNLDDVLRIDRSLKSRVSPIWSKSWDSVLQRNTKPISDDDKVTVAYGNAVLPRISAGVGDYLKSAKSPPRSLADTAFTEADWSGTDLTGTNLSGVELTRINLKGARLNVSDFGNIVFYGVAWWEAKEISPQFRHYLAINFACNPRQAYGAAGNIIFTQDQCGKIMSSLPS